MPLNLINFTPLVENDGTITPINRIFGILRYGQTWIKEVQAQETVITLLKKLLSDRFTLIRNFTLPDEEISIPILLISGGGVWIIAVSDATGIFKTQGKELLEIDNKTQDFVPAKQNLVMRTLLLSRVFEEFLKKNNITVPPLESVLIFTNPGVDVTAGDTGVRVLLSDALSRFASNLMTTPVRVEVGTTKRIIELIKEAHIQGQNKVENKSGGIKLNFSFSTNQWIILAAMIIFLGFTLMLLFALYFSS